MLYFLSINNRNIVLSNRNISYSFSLQQNNETDKKVYTTLDVSLILFYTTVLLLMNFAQKVIDCLYRVKGDKRNLNKYCTPIAHGTIPQTRQFHCF